MSRGLRKIRRQQQRDLLRQLGLGNQAGILRFVGSVWNEQMEKFKQMAIAEAETKEELSAEAEQARKEAEVGSQTEVSASEGN